jgi:NADH-quinone oxidoreductase subunit K
MIGIEQFIVLGSLIFVIGVIGIAINQHNLISLLMSIELILLACNTNFIAFSKLHQTLVGEVFVFFVLGIAAIEAAIGLAIMVLLFRQHKTIDSNQFSELSQ